MEENSVKIQSSNRTSKMNRSFNFLAFLVFCSLSAASANSVNIECIFLSNVMDYTCLLDGISIPDDESLEIVIGGWHPPNRTNADVTMVMIGRSNIPFIITQLFTTFPNLSTLDITRESGLTWIQTGAFANASNLEIISIQRNKGLRELQANAFSGASRAVVVFLYYNNIDSVHENAFEGMTRLLLLSLNSNQVRNLPPKLLSSLKNLISFTAADNQLNFIDGNFFENNERVISINLSTNRINALGRNLLDRNTELQAFEILENRCADDQWYPIEDENTVDRVLDGLDRCFSNADSREFCIANFLWKKFLSNWKFCKCKNFCFLHKCKGK